jgi:alkylation response protein AidB-like acyl-CoA dehydrogenase
MAGAADAVLAFTVAYAFDRASFGRPLASYQALKHRFADMKLWLEAAHAGVAGAGDALDADRPDAESAVSAVKAYAGDQLLALVHDCTQIHGGIGVTWDHDLHLYLRRIAVARAVYGTPEAHRERLAVLAGV